MVAAPGRKVEGIACMGWTADIVGDRFAEAAATLRLSPTLGRSPSARLRAAWPDVPEQHHEAYGYSVATVRPALPGGAALDRLDEVLGWVALWLSHKAAPSGGLPFDAGLIAWRKASGWPLARIAKERALAWGGRLPIGGNSAPSLKVIARAALDHVAEQLQERGDPVRLADDSGLPRDTQKRPGGASRRVPDARPVQNPEPCGTCAAYQAVKPIVAGAGGKCLVWRVPVSPLRKAASPPGAPCWRAKPAPAATSAPAASRN
jgi:hypothetical protein